MPKGYATPYADPLWQQVRLKVLKGAGYRCELKFSKNCKGTANSVHHIVAWSEGGSWFGYENLQSACGTCQTAEKNSRTTRWSGYTGNQKTCHWHQVKQPGCPHMWSRRWEIPYEWDLTVAERDALSI